MAASSQSHADTNQELDSHETPVVSICESSPGNAVFLETGNTDGWIASDLTVTVEE